MAGTETLSKLLLYLYKPFRLMEDSANEVSDFYLDSVKIGLFPSDFTSHLRVRKIQSWSEDSYRSRAHFVDLNQRFSKCFFQGQVIGGG